MPLTLGNDLTGLVSREVDAAGTKASGLGSSMTTGNNTFVEVVDAFLGNSLRDGEAVLTAVGKNTAYSINLLTTTDEYLKVMTTSLQEALKTISTAGTLSSEKLNVLQKNLDDKRAQVALLIKSAEFDGKGLLKGDATNLQMQVGLNVSDKLGITVSDLSAGKLFKNNASQVLNNYLGGAITRVTGYANQAALDLAKKQNVNFAASTATTAAQLATAIYNTHKDPAFARIDNANQAPTLKAQIAIPLNVRLAAAINAAIAVNPMAQAITGGATAINISTAAQAAVTAIGNATDGANDINAIADAVAARVQTYVGSVPGAVAHAVGTAAQVRALYIGLADNGLGLATASAADLQTALGNPGALNEFRALMADNQATTLNTEASRAMAQDIFQTALNTVRAEQAAVANQKANVAEAADALRATTNVTQKAADSYLKTDYVQTAQQYSETIRKMVASITSLQAANKIPEAAQRLIDGLAR